MTKHWAISHFY